MDKQKPQVLDESGDKYKYGFVTEIEAETVPKGLNADIIRLISRKKNEPKWLLRLIINTCSTMPRQNKKFQHPKDLMRLTLSCLKHIANSAFRSKSRKFWPE